MTGFFPLLKLQLLSRFADFKPKNIKTALKEKKGRTVGMFIAILFLIIYIWADGAGTRPLWFSGARFAASLAGGYILSLFVASILAPERTSGTRR